MQKLSISNLHAQHILTTLGLLLSWTTQPFGIERSTEMRNIALTESIKVTFIGLSLVLLSYAQNPADLDPTFGNGGRVYAINTQISESVADVVIQPDKKIVVVSGWDEIGHQGLSLSRYIRNGSPDATFGSGGKVYSNLSSRPYSFGQALALQPDGKYVVLGWSCEGYVCDMYVARYLQSGQFDRTFNGNG